MDLGGWVPPKQPGVSTPGPSQAWCSPGSDPHSLDSQAQEPGREMGRGRP